MFRSQFWFLLCLVGKKQLWKRAGPLWFPQTGIGGSHCPVEPAGPLSLTPPTQTISPRVQDSSSSFVLVWGLPRLSAPLALNSYPEANCPWTISQGHYLRPLGSPIYGLHHLHPCPRDTGTAPTGHGVRHEAFCPTHQAPGASWTQNAREVTQESNRKACRRNSSGWSYKRPEKDAHKNKI